MEKKTIQQSFQELRRDLRLMVDEVRSNLSKIVTPLLEHFVKDGE